MARFDNFEGDGGRDCHFGRVLDNRCAQYADHLGGKIVLMWTFSDKLERGSWKDLKAEVET